MKTKILFILAIVFVCQLSLAGKPSGPLFLTFEYTDINSETGVPERQWLHYEQVTELKFTTVQRISITTPLTNSQTGLYSLDFKSHEDAFLFLTSLKNTKKGYEIIIPYDSCKRMAPVNAGGSSIEGPCERDDLYEASGVKVKILKTKQTMMLSQLLTDWKAEAPSK